MAKLICQCGQQIRTNAKSGTQLACPRCGNMVKVSQKVLESPGFRSDSYLLQPSTRSPKPDEKPVTKNPEVATLKNRFRFSVGLGLSFLFLSVSLGLVYLALFRTNPDEEKTEVDWSDQSESLRNSLSEFRWSSDLNWKNDFHLYANGKTVQSNAERIAQTGCLIDPQKLWDILDIQTFEKRVLLPSGSFRAFTEKTPVEKLVQKLQRFPFESISTPQATAISNWQVVGVKKHGNDLGVLVRYFYEHLNVPNFASRDSWFESLSSLMTSQEYLNVASGLYSKRNANVILDEIIERGTKEVPLGNQTIFTPLFGYMILVFDIKDTDARWCDAIALPSGITLSRSCGVLFDEDWIAFKKKVEIDRNPIPQGRTPEKTIDVFGEYSYSSDESLGKSLVFAENTPDAQTTQWLERMISSVTPDRSRQLIEIAQAVTSNYVDLKGRIQQFHSNFPGDFGCDSLLLSLWLRFHDGKRSVLVFDDFGVHFVEAADRLYSMTEDHLLLELKSRIFSSHGKVLESDQLLTLAEQAGIRSAYSYSRRIEQAVSRNDKTAVLELLAQFNSLWITQPGVILPADPRLVSRTISKKWPKASSGDNN